MKEKVILFGASNYGKTVLQQLGDRYEVIYFCDNDSNKVGTSFCGKLVISPNDLVKIIKKENAKLIITSTFFIEISIQLSNMGLNFCYIALLKNKYDPITKKWKVCVDIQQFDITKIGSLKIKENSIGLIVRNNSGLNTLALWKMIPKNILDRYDVKLIYEGDDVINYYKEVYSCKLLVTTHSNNLYYLSSPGRKCIQLWHGFPMKGIAQMSKYFNRDTNKSVSDWRRYDVITSYSLLYSTLMNACFGGDCNLYKITGAPRNDFLFNSNGREILFKLLNIDLKDKKIVFYMPTFRASLYNQYVSGNKNWSNIFGFKDFDNKAFSDLLVKNNIVFIIKMHPYEEKFVQDLIRNQKINNTYLILDEELNNSGIDLYEFMNACDLLITDYSSIYFDYLLLDRPIIFTPVDLDDYIENNGLLYGPYDHWTPGPKVLEQKTLQDEILKNLYGEDEYSDQRAKLSDIVHYYKDANSHVRVWKLIEDVLH